MLLSWISDSIFIILLCVCKSHCNVNLIFRKNELLGGGEFGEVFKGSWITSCGLQEVAIKMLKQDTRPASRVKLLQEATIMGQFCHPHIVKLFGAVTLDEPVSVCVYSMTQYIQMNIVVLNPLAYAGIGILGWRRSSELLAWLHPEWVSYMWEKICRVCTFMVLIHENILCS